MPETARQRPPWTWWSGRSWYTGGHARVHDEADKEIHAQQERCRDKGDVLIVNLPGKAGAVKQCLEYLLPEIAHAVEVIQKAPQE